MSRWFVIRTNIKCEEKAADNLRAAGFETYSPVQRVERFSPRKKIWRERTLMLMPRYLFLKTAGQVPWGFVRECEGVEHVLGINGMPSPLGRAEVDALDAIMLAERDLQFDQTRAAKIRRDEMGRNKRDHTRLRFAAGMLVNVTKGPFAGFTPTVVDVNAKGKVQALLEVFGRMSEVEFPSDWVEPIDESSAAA